MTGGILQTAAGLGLFLLGMVLMTRGLERLAGRALSRLLARFTRSPATGALTGEVGTAVVQSSSAATVAAVGFAGAGLLTFPQALGIVFGANVGTTMTGWLVALLGFKLDLGTIAGPLVLVGVLLHLFGWRGLKAGGMALAGFALVFVGIGGLKGGMAGLQGVVTPDSFPADGLGGRLALVGLGALITVISQSSSAGVAAAIAAVHAEAMTLPQAAAMVIGMDVGTTVTAALATIGASTQAKRTGWAHVLFNLYTAALALALLSPALALFAAGGLSADDPEVALVAFHSTFNVVGTLAILPFARPFARLVEALVPAGDGAIEGLLDEALIKEPALALKAAQTAAVRLTADVSSALAASLRTGLPFEAILAERGVDPASVGALRRYLARISTAPGRPEEHGSNQDLLHAVDRLDRLIDRASARTPDAAVRRAPELAARSAALADAALALGDEPAPEAVEAVRDVWRALEQAEPGFRRDVLERAAQRARRFTPKTGWRAAGLGVGLLILYLSAELLVDAAVGLGAGAGLSRVAIGLFTGLSTSLPELSVSVTAMRRGAGGLSLGNLVGSNVTDPLLSLGLGAAITGFEAPPADFAMPVAVWTVATLLALVAMHTRQRLDRWEAGLLTAGYLAYMVVTVL